jgi:hypothetical protein
MGMDILTYLLNNIPAITGVITALGALVVGIINASHVQDVKTVAQTNTMRLNTHSARLDNLEHPLLQDTHAPHTHEPVP